MEEEQVPLGNRYHFWESEVELVRKKTLAPDGKKFRYFDDKGIFNFVFMAWVYRWVKETSKRYLDPYMLHPLPLADQTIFWYPIFSKHVSDGIASLEAHESLSEDEKKKAKKPVRYLLFRALILTFWKRLLIIILVIIVLNTIGMSVAIFLHKLLSLLSENDLKFVTFLGLAISIVLIELLKDIGTSHIEYYVRRLSFIMDPCLRLTIFQHGLCYRRSPFGNFQSNAGACKSIIHSCSGEDKCTDNPLLCPARRYKNNEVTPKMYALILTDSYYLPFFTEAIPGFMNFLTSLTYGIILMSSQFNVKALTILIVSLSLVASMIVIELVNGLLMKYYLGIRDHRISKSSEVISGLYLIERMAFGDIGHDIITETRNDELKIIFARFLLSLVNKVLMTLIMCVNIIILVNDFVTQVRDATDDQSIDPSGLLASIFVIMKIVGPLYMVPIYLRRMLFGINAFRRLELFFRTCSPNFYLPDNRFTGRNPLPEVQPGKYKTLPKGLVVMFKKASFAWVNSRKDLLDNTGTTCLRNLDFVLNTGDLAIITGAQGSGKSNFIKAILGDMTLVEGSMAVLPLSTNMPIFYASQKVWLQKGTIKSNITFGHRFDEKLYNTVLKAVELEHDISTWEGGDLRKISENGYSLSGGQRVRVGLARAIYAYLIFSKTSREESGSDHSFLVVLDDCFTGLDPFVAKTIFKNLFENGKGLLAKGDVSTVLTISRNMLDACVSSEVLGVFPDAPIYTLRNETLVHENMLSSFIKNEIGNLEPPTPSDERVGLHAMPSKLRRMCSSDDYARGRRREIVESKYAESPTVQVLYKRHEVKDDDSKGFYPFKIYFRAAGWPIILFFLLTLIFSTLDSTKFIITSKVSDSIAGYTKSNKGVGVSLEEVKDYCYRSLRWIVILSIAVMIGILFRAVAMTYASFNGSLRIHEYCINSVFTNSSGVLNIKKSLSSIQTFLYMDTLSIDNMLSYYLHDVFVLLIEMGVQMLTLFFMMPWSAPIAIGLCLSILRFIVYYYIKACKNIAFSRLEAYNQIDSTIESAISGLSVCRSFKNEWKFVHTMAEHVDYNIRGTHLNNSAMFWSSIASRSFLTPLALFILLFPIIRSRYCDTGIKVGYYTIAYSLFLSVNNYFANFLEISYYLQLHLLPMRRFENFVLPNTKIKFDKRRNIHQTDVIVDHSASTGDGKLSSDNIKSTLRRRRHNEYAERRAVHCTSLKMLFFKHQVNLFDVSKYAVPGTTRIKLDNVSVHVVSRDSNEKHAILKNVTCSADTSDIIGVIGRTGAGKSTLLSVLQNLARNRGGSVLLDGCDLNDMPKNVTRQIIGVLPQLPFVFRGWTVRRFIDPRMLFEDADIEMALKNCGLLKFVMNLPGGKGIDTVIIPDHYHKDMPRYLKRAYYGPTLRPHELPSADNVNIDYGSALSNSQLRTLSVARLVLYREFYKILLVDEPPEDESGASKTADIPIYDLIKTHFQHCTTFIAAHDASILRFCTSVWVFHKGSLIRTCKTEDIVDTGSLSKIIEDCISEEN
ncbi:ABC transporter, ATP-binding protein domain containing protein [Theileria equi strain WA]|uniref:ABC transporter, ATP-binding protein domain containing protein n=1 Tax=Theileria equi strain WA TaxID=1537102 RepID=L1LDD8_THEEQ|nr:ABC transporter, ATP-binding protein domain containing protein [Theileria equi strain WA]EKX73361.1 ABC transporter, ATP-binding protein domain containing protein [Theileria equi strain WA]|eukprot:XP_004832813.1 ABC transporter, ATP-binding protein domain containing protein [Theileria equi strain WA]